MALACDLARLGRALAGGAVRVFRSVAVNAPPLCYCHRQLLDDRSDMDLRTKPETPCETRLNMLNDTTRSAVLAWWGLVVAGTEQVTVRSFVRIVSRELGDRHVWLADSTVRDLWNLLYPQYAELTTEGIDK